MDWLRTHGVEVSPFAYRVQAPRELKTLWPPTLCSKRTGLKSWLAPFSPGVEFSIPPMLPPQGLCLWPVFLACLACSRTSVAQLPFRVEVTRGVRKK